MKADRLRGVVTPLLTPYDDDGAIARDLFEQHAARCLAAGSHYLAPFGTTGEALSNTSRERMDALDGLVASGAARADRLMPGTGLCSLGETAALTRHAVELGCAAALVLPPFFYVDADEEGLYRYFSELIERLGPAQPRICLYHIPQLAGIGFTPALAARLAQALPGVVVGLKDSSGDWENTKAVIESAPALSVFPGSEGLMLDAMEIGGAGCISASCNSNAAAIRELYDLAAEGRFDEARALEPAVNRHRVALRQAGLIPGLKSLTAFRSGDSRWLNLRPPFENADPGQGRALSGTLGGADIRCGDR